MTAIDQPIEFSQLRGAAKRKGQRAVALLRQGWRPIDEYRTEMGFVLVLGASGYVCTPYQSAVAIMDQEFRPHDPWIAHDGSYLSSRHLEPEWFRELFLPN